MPQTCPGTSFNDRLGAVRYTVCTVDLSQASVTRQMMATRIWEALFYSRRHATGLSSLMTLTRHSISSPPQRRCLYLALHYLDIRVTQGTGLECGSLTKQGLESKIYCQQKTMSVCMHGWWGDPDQHTCCLRKPCTTQGHMGTQDHQIYKFYGLIKC